MKKQRLDVAMVERGLADTRSKAQSLIMARRVLVNGTHVDKAGASVADDDDVAIEALEHPWVGRGGMKLAHALREFAINVDGKVCADIGASTGGFTDVMLKSGARKVYAIDVSFISLKLILPAVATFLDGELVALIKPQFEVGKGDVGKGGIVRDAAKRDEAVQSVVAFAREIGFEVKGVIESPVKGAEGNVEFLMHAARGSRADLRATTPDARP